MHQVFKKFVDRQEHKAARRDGGWRTKVEKWEHALSSRGAAHDTYLSGQEWKYGGGVSFGAGHKENRGGQRKSKNRMHGQPAHRL